MKRLIHVLGLLLCLGAPPVAADTPLLDRTYLGVRSFTTGEELPLKTRFFGTAEGLAGTYHFVGDGKMNAGDLKFLERQGDLLLFEWTSFNGFGLLELRLSDDGRRFDGAWYGPRQTQGTWTGVLEEEN